MIYIYIYKHTHTHTHTQVEEYVYYFRDALSNKLAAYEEEGKRAAFVKELTEVEEWLYGDGEGANKGKFVEKLESLQKTGEPISMRAREFEMLPDAFARLDKAIQVQFFCFEKRGLNGGCDATHDPLSR